MCHTGRLYALAEDMSFAYCSLLEEQPQVLSATIFFVALAFVYSVLR